MRMLWTNVDKWLGKSTDKLTGFVLKMDNAPSTLLISSAPRLFLSKEVTLLAKSITSSLDMANWLDVS